MLLWRFETRDRDLLVRAFVTYLRTLMEYNCVVCMVAWPKARYWGHRKGSKAFYKKAHWTEKKTILWPTIEISKLAQALN